MNEVKCVYCGTAPNNSTTKKELKVCCCYMLHKRGNTYIQYHRGDRVPTYVNVNELVKNGRE